MLVSVQSGMIEYILSTQTVSIMNLEEILYHSTTEYSDTKRIQWWILPKESKNAFK